MGDKSRWQAEFDGLPEWAKQIVRGLAGNRGFGMFNHKTVFGEGFAKDASAYHFLVAPEASEAFFNGMCGAVDLAKALTAPWPAPPPPVREKRAFNVVELMADDEDEGGFDQPCCFGNRVAGHAVYCHNAAWPDSPRKCQRSQSDADHKHEDCPGFVANPDAADSTP